MPTGMGFFFKGSVIPTNSNVSGSVDSNGEQTAELQIAGAQNNGPDQKFICKVQTSAFPVAGSPASQVTAASNVYGMLIQALDLST